MIMKNYFAKSSVALMVVSAALASCTQEEIVQNDVPTRQTLNISVNTQDFVSEDGSRATTGTDAGRTTVFAEGDEMGMYVISNDGTVICNNEKFVYNGITWEAANELYYWKNANYIAYYPYNADLTAQNITSVEKIKTEFAESDDFYTQNTAEAYEKADLMLAEVKNPANGTIQFDLAHQFSMVEINVPVRKYVTKTGYNYTAPVSLNWDTPLTIDEKAVTPYSTGKGSFRFIVPSATDLELTLNGHLVYDEGIPVNFGSSTESQSVNLASGTCKVYNVTYDKISSDVVTRDLEVGDYYYSDGSIYPYGNQDDNDLTEPVKNGCIGVIFEVGTGVPNTPWTHGSVLALKSLGQAKWSANKCTVEGNMIETLSDDVTVKSGYEVTLALVKTSGFLWNDAANLAYNLGKGEYDSQYAAPVYSSGWYLPSIADWVEVIQNLGGDTDFTLSTTGVSGDVISKIKNYIETIDSGLATDYFLKYTLSATEKNETDAWALELSGETFKFLNRQKVQNQTNPSNKFGACAVLSF